MALAPTNLLMIGTWVSCVSWALSEPEVVERFRADTGNRYVPSSTPIDQMIDEAAGIQGQFIEQFVRWVNANIWGEYEGRACNGDEAAAR